MRSQFDPDVWAALLLIIAVGVGGSFMLSILANTMSMHGVLNLFDREISQKGMYILSSSAESDYGHGYTTQKDANFSQMRAFYIISKPTSKSMYSEFWSAVNNFITSGWSLYMGSENHGMEIKGICTGIVMEDNFQKALEECNEKVKGRNVYQFEGYVYSPGAPCVAYVIFRGGNTK